jgi:hypothetical protein
VQLKENSKYTTIQVHLLFSQRDLIDPIGEIVYVTLSAIAVELNVFLEKDLLEVIPNYATLSSQTRVRINNKGDVKVLKKVFFC